MFCGRVVNDTVQRQTLSLDDTLYVSTDGPTPESTYIIPQMFFRVQGAS